MDASAHHEVSGHQADGKDEPRRQIIAIDKRAERHRSRVRKRPCPVNRAAGVTGRRLERATHERAGEPDPREQANSRPGAAMGERFTRGPEHQGRGDRECEAGTRAREMNADGSPSHGWDERVGVLELPGRRRDRVQDGRWQRQHLKRDNADARNQDEVDWTGGWVGRDTRP